MPFRAAVTGHGARIANDDCSYMGSSQRIALAGSSPAWGQRD
jgi:hypothetical protein